MHLKLYSFLFLFLPLCASAQSYHLQFQKLDSRGVSNIRVYVDISRSMAAFFDPTASNSNGAYSTRISTWMENVYGLSIKKKIGLQCYGFDSVCYEIPIEFETSSLLAASDNFSSKENIYSSAIKSAMPQVGNKQIVFMVTDGVPSLTSGTNLDLIRAQEFEKIGRDFTNFLAVENHAILIYRLLCDYNGTYYLSDTNKIQTHSGKRNLYVLVFCERNQSGTVDSFFANLPAEMGLRRFSVYNDDWIKHIRKTGPERVDGDSVRFCIGVTADSRVTADMISQIRDERGNLLRFTTNRQKGGELQVTFSVAKRDIGRKPSGYHIVFKPADSTLLNDLIINGPTESAALQNGDFFAKTFRLNFLAAPLASRMTLPAADIPFRIYCSNSLQRWAEPLLGFIGPPAPIDNVYASYVPLQLCIYSWLFPALAACFLYLVMFNYKVIGVNNDRAQWLWWISGLLFSVFLLLGLTVLFMQASYDTAGTVFIKSPGYKIKHFISHPLWAVIIYSLSSLLLKRHPDNLAPNIPV